MTSEEMKLERERLLTKIWPLQKIESVRVSIHCYDADRTLVAGYSSSPGGQGVDLAALRVLAGEPAPDAELRRELGELVETTLAESKVATGAPLYDAGYSDCARVFADAVEALLAKGGGK
ncbi:MAG TPA: hypothetical protein VGK73_31615 [Polyangiaceae bacterium]